jgi:AcrR family transcriptional regulator
MLYQVTEPDATTPTRGPRGPYAKSAEVRDRALAACIELFSQTGFHGVSMREIAQRAGISHTGLMHHFANKTELLDAALRARYEQFRPVMQGLSPDAILPAQMEIIRDNAEHPSIVQLHAVMGSEAITPDHPAHEYYRLRLDQFRAYVSQAFADLADRGLLRVDLDPVELATLYIAVIDGLQIQWLYNPAQVSVERGVRAFLSGVVVSHP